MSASSGKLSVIFAKSRVLRTILDIVIVTLCAFAVLLSWKLRIPFYPVPFTMQTVAVTVTSILIGRTRALASILLFAAMVGPFHVTGGYILGFFLVPLIIGNGAINLPPWNLFLRIIVSHMTVLAVGTSVLAYFVGVRTAFVGGFLFFIPSGIFKGIIAFAIALMLRRRSGR